MEAATIAALLPHVFRRAASERSALYALLDAMAALLAPVEDTLDGLDACFDPDRAPLGFVALSARWLGLEPLLGALREAGAAGLDEEAALRAVVLAWPRLTRARGTAAGLVDLLETASGVRGFEVREAPPEGTEEGPARPRDHHVWVVVPPAAVALAPLVEALVEHEKPAHVTHSSVTADEHGWRELRSRRTDPAERAAPRTTSTT